jgi:hypothetical protein
VKFSTRCRSWSSSEEHFRYDAASGSFWRDREADSHDLGPGRGPSPGQYIKALTEVRLAFEQSGTDDWETAQLLMLYGVATEAAGAAQVAGELPSSFEHREHRRLPRLQDRHLEDLLGHIVHVCELVIARHWPNAPVRLEAATKNKMRGRVRRMNRTLKELDMLAIPEIRGVVDLWLRSFDRPYRWGRENGIHGRNCVEFIDACLSIIRAMLVRSGPIAQTVTTEMRSER